jgi:type IV secretion system protein VirB6
VILISPNSWDFFNYYLFSFFLQGAMELVYDFAQPIADVNTVDVSNLSLTELTNAVFAIYNKSFTQIFNPTIWTKIWALACTNLVGFPLALIIAISLVSYVICIIRAIVIYIISLITLFILFLIFPILLCFVLFKKTADIFQSVIGNMLSMMLQPVFVFVAIAFLHEIFLQALYAALSFTACPTCLLSLSLKDRYICIPPKIWWVSLFGAHYPMEAGVGSPVSLILPVICVLILAQCMDGLVGLMSRLAERIATASFYGFNLGHAGATAQSIVGKQMTSFAGAVLNVDLASGNSKQGRQAALDNKTSQNNKGQTSSSKDASSAAKRSQGKTDGKNGS